MADRSRARDGERGDVVLRPISEEQAAAAFERHAQFVFSREHEVLIAEDNTSASDS